LDYTDNIFTKDPTEKIFQKHAVKLVKTIPKGTGMCKVTTFPRNDIIFESQQNEWIKVLHRNKMKSQGQDKSPHAILKCTH
jgi:hypothetical protein